MKSGQVGKASKSEVRYKEIEKWLRKRVQSGSAGELLPSEVEIAAKFNVSRMTARQAVMNLMREGLVDRRRGAGTFIASRPMHRREGILLSFTEDMKRRGLKPTSILISAQLEDPTSSDIQALKLETKSKVVVIQRIRLADGVPLSLERVALIPQCEAVLESDLVNGSLHEALRRINFAPFIANGWLNARLANAQEAKKLEIASKAPLLVETRVIEDEKGVPFEYTETAYVANRYVVDIRLNCAPSVIAPYSAAPMAPA